MKKIRLIVAGLGYWGKRWVREISGRGGEFEIAGIVDSDPQTAQKVGEEFGVSGERRFLATHEAIEGVKADGIVVVVPPDRHLDVIKQAVSAGLHILEEKPLANSYAEAVEIGRLLKARPNLVFMVDQSRRWRSHNQTAKKFVDGGGLGRVGQILITHIQANKKGGFRSTFPNIIIDDMAIHHFDMIRLLTGSDPVEVYARSHNPSWSWYQTNQSSAVLCSMTGGVEGCYFGSWVGRGKLTSWEGDITVIGEKGTLQIVGEHDLDFYPAEPGEEQTHQWEGKKRERLQIHAMEREETTYALQEFLECVRGQRQPETGYSDNLKSFAMVCMAQESLKTNRPISVGDLASK